MIISYGDDPSVLKPIYNFAKKEYLSRGKNVDKLSYRKWVKDTLDIKFEDGTKILKIEFKDHEEEFILEVLNQIKNKYQNLD